MMMLDEFFECVFIIKKPDESIKQLIATQNANLISLEEGMDLRSEAEYLNEHHLKEEELFVLDGYDFDEVYKNTIAQSRVKLICIDDLYQNTDCIDLIINHGGAATRNNYKENKKTQFALGPKFALLRPPFWQYARNKVPHSVIDQNLFICFGGSDPENQTLKTLQNISSSSIDKCFIVLGSAYQYREALEAYINSSGHNVELLTNLSAEELVEVMSKCQSAITSPSTISYEYLSIGGLLYLKQTADNQLHLYNYLLDQKLAFKLEAFPVDDYHIKSASLIRQQNIFDGLQAKRFNYLFKSLVLEIKDASIADKQLFFDWTNEEMTRKQSFSQDAVPWEDHVNWFDTKLTSRSSLMYVLELNCMPIGQVRFDLTSENIIISFSLDRDYRGKGLGTAILHKALITLLSEKNPQKTIIGYVRKGNVPSQKAFKLLEFTEEETQAYEDSYQYTYNYGI